MSAIDDIGHERQRQIDDERFDARHDDKHDFGELLDAPRSLCPYCGTQPNTSSPHACRSPDEAKQCVWAHT